MRAGEVNLNNSVLEGASIYGIEIAPDNALPNQRQWCGYWYKLTHLSGSCRDSSYASFNSFHSWFLRAHSLSSMYLFAMVIVILMSPLSGKADGSSLATYIVPSTLFNQHVESFQGLSLRDRAE